MTPPESFLGWNLLGRVHREALRTRVSWSQRSGGISECSHLAIDHAILACVEWIWERGKQWGKGFNAQHGCWRAARGRAGASGIEANYCGACGGDGIANMEAFSGAEHAPRGIEAKMMILGSTESARHSADNGRLSRS